MKTGFCGTFVISWAQTELNGFAAGPLHTLDAGASWRWTGEAVRVDGPGDVLRLERTDESEELRRRAAAMVQRLVGAALEAPGPLSGAEEDPAALRDCGFVLTDGRQTFTATVIDTGAGRPPLLMFLDELPPRGRELWVVQHSLDRKVGAFGAQNGGVICFTPGTRITTPRGMVAIEDLREGDLVQTADNGPQEVCWIGSRRMTGARLMAMPHLRPVRISAGVLGSDVPDQVLHVSPGHRILLRGGAARELFNASEVLVAARDLINGESVVVDQALREVTYIHLMFERHQVLWANGVETESFHPAAAALGSLEAADRMRLLAAVPGLENDPLSYGDFARRSLSAPEAAILTHAA